MRHHIRFLVTHVVILILSVSAFTPVSAAPDSTRFAQVQILGLQGRVDKALALIDSLNQAQLSDAQRALAQAYLSRFRTQDEKPVYRTSDTVASELLAIYQHYWRDVLLANERMSHFDSLLTDSVIVFLKRHADAFQTMPHDTLRANFPDTLQSYLKSRGLYAAVGKTGGIFDLLMHAKETDTTYVITTPEEVVRVKVVFMDSIISNGWEEYATFGKYYPGGWATSDALYCVRESYDLSSENFQISYLMHEGKHFADYKVFPKLSGADLEYRAKLVEFSALQKNMYKLIQFLLKNMSEDRTNSHGFANSCLMRDLSQSFGQKAVMTDTSWWKTISITAIHEHAVSLLKNNTAALKAAGADTVSAFLK